MHSPRECIMCGGYSSMGIKIFNRFICCECEKTLVNTDICDDMYDKYKELIKKQIYYSKIKRQIK